MSIQNQTTIVVVCNDSLLCSRISNFFVAKGYLVSCYPGAAEALKASAVDGASWSVLLTDYHFTEISPIDFTSQMKSSLPRLPLIFMTSPDLAESAAAAIGAGADDFVSKPVHLIKLLIAVERALKVRNLVDHNSKIRKILDSKIELRETTGRSPGFLAAIDVARRVSRCSASVLITGESGTGKEIFANFIHDLSKQTKGPFVAINCAAIPENLLESELFGHAKGSFSGATEKRIGLFEAAENGTLFLDEIGDLSLQLQAKLLRVLQEKEIRRVGENQSIAINCRIVSATHKDLASEIREGRFREDLFYRLNVIPIAIPPLRDRPEDLIPLAEVFLEKFAVANGSNAKCFSKAAIRFILGSPWRGNVRELENAIERAVILSLGAEVDVESIGHENSLSPPFAPKILPTQPLNAFLLNHQEALPSLDEVVHEYIRYAIGKCGGARDLAARSIGIDRKTLYRRLRPPSSKTSVREIPGVDEPFCPK